jgi:hypothetical protein
VLAGIRSHFARRLVRRNFSGRIAMHNAQ